MRFLWEKWFSRRPAAEPPDKPWLDARWEQLNASGVKCTCCGQFYKGVFDLAFAAPSAWPGDESHEPNAAVLDALHAGRDILTDDFCIMGAYRFIRCVLPFPILGTKETFSFGLWGSIKPVYFGEVLAAFDDMQQKHLGPYFTWISNQLPGCGAGSIRGNMVMQDGRRRPIIQIIDDENRYALMQRNGMPIAELFDIYAQYGHRFEPVMH